MKVSEKLPWLVLFSGIFIFLGGVWSQLQLSNHINEVNRVQRRLVSSQQSLVQAKQLLDQDRNLVTFLKEEQYHSAVRYAENLVSPLKLLVLGPDCRSVDGVLPLGIVEGYCTKLQKDLVPYLSRKESRPVLLAKAASYTDRTPRFYFLADAEVPLSSTLDQTQVFSKRKLSSDLFLSGFILFILGLIYLTLNAWRRREAQKNKHEKLLDRVKQHCGLILNTKCPYALSHRLIDEAMKEQLRQSQEIRALNTKLSSLRTKTTELLEAERRNRIFSEVENLLDNSLVELFQLMKIGRGLQMENLKHLDQYQQAAQQKSQILKSWTSERKNLNDRKFIRSKCERVSVNGKSELSHELDILIGNDEHTQQSVARLSASEKLLKTNIERCYLELAYWSSIFGKQKTKTLPLQGFLKEVCSHVERELGSPIDYTLEIDNESKSQKIELNIAWQVIFVELTRLLVNSFKSQSLNFKVLSKSSRLVFSLDIPLENHCIKESKVCTSSLKKISKKAQTVNLNVAEVLSTKGYRSWLIFTNRSSHSIDSSMQKNSGQKFSTSSKMESKSSPSTISS